ncbi:MAG: DUF4430 domain-containing protein [Candidatus Zixiibacteriota bacterium]
MFIALLSGSTYLTIYFMMKKLQSRKAAEIIKTILIIFLACSCSQKADKNRDNLSGDSSDSTASIAKRDSVVIEVAGVDSQTVFDLLRNTHQVQYRSSAIGVFITAIDSIENSGGIYWVYSVNDSMPPVACDKFHTKNGDVVKWHFRKSRQ